MNSLHYVTSKILLIGCLAPRKTQWLNKLWSLLFADKVNRKWNNFHLTNTNQYHLQFCIAVCLETFSEIKGYRSQAGKYKQNYASNNINGGPKTR